MNGGATAQPALTSLAGDLYEELRPMQFAEPETGYALARFLAALATLLDPVAEVVRSGPEGEDGWTAAADPQRCPTWMLEWLSMWVGLQRDHSRPEDRTRYLIANSPSLARGTRQAMEAAARATLTGSQRLWFRERFGGSPAQTRPYYLTVQSYATETPNPEATWRAVYGAKPAGLILEFSVLTGQFYLHVQERHADYAGARGSYPTYAGMRDAEPVA